MATVEEGYSLEEHHEGESRHLDAPVLRLDLAKELADLRQGRSWQVAGYGSKTLVKYEDLRVVLLALNAGASLGEHRTVARISIHTLEGRVRVKLPDEPVELRAGGLLSLAPSISHDLEALEDSVVLLTIAWPRPQPATAQRPSSPRRTSTHP